MAEAGARKPPRQAWIHQCLCYKSSLTTSLLQLCTYMSSWLPDLRVLGHAGYKEQVSSKNKKHYGISIEQRKPMKCWSMVSQ